MADEPPAALPDDMPAIRKQAGHWGEESNATDEINGSKRMEEFGEFGPRGYWAEEFIWVDLMPISQCNTGKKMKMH